MPHISLVFREMWDSMSLDRSPSTDHANCEDRPWNPTSREKRARCWASGTRGPLVTGIRYRRFVTTAESYRIESLHFHRRICSPNEGLWFWKGASCSPHPPRLAVGRTWAENEFFKCFHSMPNDFSVPQRKLRLALCHPYLHIALRIQVSRLFEE